MTKTMNDKSTIDNTDATELSAYLLYMMSYFSSVFFIGFASSVLLGSLPHIEGFLATALFVSLGVRACIPVESQGSVITFKKMIGKVTIDAKKVEHIYTMNKSTVKWETTKLIIKMPGFLNYYHTVSDEKNNIMEFFMAYNVTMKPVPGFSEIEY